MSRLVWGVKESLRRYVEDSASGWVEAREGAERDSKDLFWFAASGSGSPHEEPTILRFTGVVEFRGHGGMLSLPVRDPWLEERGTGWVLSIVDPDDQQTRVDFVTLDVFEPVSAGTLKGRGVALTNDGADLILGPYELGTAFDDLEVVP